MILLCKCGDPITNKALEQIKQMKLSQVGVPDYPRCEYCLKILAQNYMVLLKRGRTYHAYKSKGFENRNHAKYAY